jgi:hypothetical protein
VNAATDPGFTLRMREAQEDAKKNAARRRRGHLAKAKSIVAEAGLEGSPLAERLADRLGELDHEITELGRIVKRVGRTRRDGSLGSVYERYLTLIERDRVEMAKLLERLEALGKLAGNGEPVVEGEVLVRMARQLVETAPPPPAPSAPADPAPEAPREAVATSAPEPDPAPSLEDELSAAADAARVVPFPFPRQEPLALEVV